MSRKEEISQQAYEKAKNYRFDFAKIAIKNGFIAGAEWADKSMIEKVCNWLERNCMGFILTEDEISDFRKAMEG